MKKLVVALVTVAIVLSAELPVYAGNVSERKIGEYRDGFALVEEKYSAGAFLAMEIKRYYYLDMAGLRAFNGAEFFWANDFSEGLAAVSNGKYGYFINTQGAQAFPLTFIWTDGKFNGGVCYVQLDTGQDYAINQNGDLLFEVVFPAALGAKAELGDFQDGRAVFRYHSYVESWGNKGTSYEGLFGFIGKDGKLLFGASYADVLSYFDANGQPRFAERSAEYSQFFANTQSLYSDAFQFSEGYAAVQELLTSDGSRSWYFIDSWGSHAFNGARFDLVSSFSEGLAKVELDDLWYYIDTGGNFAFDGRSFRFASSFENGCAQVGFVGDPSSYSIDKHGNIK